MQTTTI